MCALDLLWRWRLWFCHDRTGRLVVEGQSNPLFVPSVMKTHIPLTDDPAQPEEDLMQRYGERIEKLSQQERVSKFCTDAGFLTTVEVWQYFMTKDTEEFSQLACRDYTLPRCERLSEPKGWIRGNTEIGPVYWKLQRVAYKVNMEWKSGLSLWTGTILTRGSEFLMARLVANLNNKEQNDNEQETSEMQFEDHALKTKCTCFCEPIKG